MRLVIALSACMNAAFAANAAAQSPPGAEAIANILTGTKSWSVFAEFTTGSVPSDKATRLAWQFYRDGRSIKGRTTNMAQGYNCAFDVVVSDDGIEFGTRARWCSEGPETVMTRLVHDPSDKRYPFKNLSTPLKWWFAPQP